MIIFMWSGPRNLSTALMRSFENRDDTEILDEPFYAYYLDKTKLRHPMYKEIINSYPKNENTIIKDLFNIPNNSEIYYQKHMTHHLLDISNLEWLNKGKNCFLIRHPAKVINSYIKKNEIKNIKDLGFKKQYEIFSLVKNKLDTNPIVVNADDILKDPKKIITLLCDKLKIKYTNKMIDWPLGSRKSDGIWGDVWYENVKKSSTFIKYKEVNLEVPKKYQELYLECLKIYNLMNKFAI